METQTIDELLQDLRDRDKTIKELEEDISDKDMEIDNLKDEVKDLERQLEDAESKVWDAEDLSDTDIESEFFSRNNIDGTMVNEIKVEKFFSNMQKFSLEQFEEFLKDKAAVL